jgi:hypothetical protein
VGTAVWGMGTLRVRERVLLTCFSRCVGLVFFSMGLGCDMGVVSLVACGHCGMRFLLWDGIMGSVIWFKGAMLKNANIVISTSSFCQGTDMT